MENERRKVIVIGGEKGGTGKSTTATNLAIMSSLMLHDVILIDATTKQSSSSKFMERRRELGILPTPTSARIQGKYLHEELEQFKDKFEIVIVDVGGLDSSELRSAMAAKCVDKMYSPFKASEFDLETVESMDELVYLAKSYNPKLECNAIFNQIPSTGGLEEVLSAKELLKTYEFIKPTDIVIYNRKSISSAAKFALSVVEYEEDMRKKLPPYRVKDYLYKGSLEFCHLYKIVFSEEFDCPTRFPSLRQYLTSKEENNS